MSSKCDKNESTTEFLPEHHRPQGSAPMKTSSSVSAPPSMARIGAARSMDTADLVRRQKSDPALDNFDCDAGALHTRTRAHTEPVDLQPGSLGLGVMDHPTSISANKKTDSDATTLPAAPSSEEDDRSNDEEIQRAMAMAQAIQNNPHMTPDEIRELLAKEHITTSMPVAATAAKGSAPPLVPARLTNIMFSASSTTATSSSELSSNNKTTFRERARGRFSELISGTSLKNVSGPAASSTEAAVAEGLAMSTTTAALETNYNKRETMLPSSSGASSTTSPKDAVLRLPFRHSHAVKNARSPPISPRPTDTPEIVTTTSALRVPTIEETMIPILSSGSEQQQHQQQQQVGGSATSVASMSQQQKSTPIRISGIAWKRRGGMGKYSTTAAWERRRIELQGTKLLYYLRDASEEDENTIGATDSKDENDVLSSLSSVNNAAAVVPDEAQDAVSEGIVVTKRATWLEQAASNWVANNEDPTAPRGYIDLAKEKATVHAAFGHSGAPSPFALSIKVRGETKWKLCFDYHKTQMEWLAAITDVVVQNSVDNYNALLLQSVDPSNQVENAIFVPPSVSQPPSKDADGGHRLWSVEPYVCSNKVGINLSSLLADYTSRTDDGENDAMEYDYTTREEGYELLPDSLDAQDLAKEHEHITEMATKAWSIPERHILYVIGVLNIALVHARASSMTMEGFWYLVVLANLGLYLCLTKEPDWQSVLTLAVRVTLNDNPTSTRGKGIKGFRKGAEKANAPDEKRKRPKYVPTAGCSTVKLDQPSDEPVNSKGDHFAGWRSPSGETLLVRSHGYLTTKQKVPSPGELYELLTVDIFESPSRYPDMAPRVKLPKVEFNDGMTQKTWRSPDIFIVSIALPTDPPKMGRTSSDGGGYTITMYYGMKQQTRDILKRVTGDGYDPSTEKVNDPQKSQINAVRLLEEWCRRAPTDPKFQSRFKVVPNAHNLKEIGMPGWISKYNGKPFLIKRPGQTGFLYSHPELSCMEFDISLHPFPYLAKQAICFMKGNYFKRVLVTFGFVIEGRADDELPECLIGLMQLCYPDPQYAIQADDFFAGTSQRSFD